MAIYKDPDYMQKWRAVNAERIKQQRRAYYEAHRDRTKQEAMEWARSNRYRYALSCKAATANRRYQGKITIEDVETIIERCGRVCYWCGKADLAGRDLTLEHLKPMNDKSVIVIACHRCNCRRLHLKKDE